MTNGRRGGEKKREEEAEEKKQAAAKDPPIPASSWAGHLQDLPGTAALDYSPGSRGPLRTRVLLGAAQRSSAQRRGLRLPPCARSYPIPRARVHPYTR